LLLLRIGQLAVKPLLIVFDPFARSFEGGDENHARDVGLAVAASTGLIRDTGATVLLLHHTGKEQKTLERGSSALRAAADTMISVRRKEAVITVFNNKQKNDEGFSAITLRLKRVSLGEEVDGNEVTSCVLESTNALHGAVKNALVILGTFPEGSDSSTWHKAIAEHLGGIRVADRTFHNWREALLELGLVEAVPDKAHHYRLTEAGKSVVADVTPDELVDW
jgi:hypothetical protein